MRRRHGGAGAQVRGGRREKNDEDEPADHALGRSRGGLTTKIHLLCDAQGHPLTFRLTAGQAHESTVLDDVLIGADEQLFDHGGEPIAWPVALAGDKGYRADWIDVYLVDPGIHPVIPSNPLQDPDARPGPAT